MEFPIEFGKAWALTKRDMSKWSTYKTQAFVSILASLVGIASWGFNATYRNRLVPQYGTDYVSFLVVGVLVATLVLPIQQNVQTRLSPWTLETILMTGIRTPTFVLGTVAWTYLLSVILFIPQLLIGIYVFQAHLIVNYVSFVLALFISSAIIFALAIINTGFRIVTKSNDPITWSLNVAAQLLAGMTFPVQHLDDYLPGLSTISWVLPQTWIYHILRLATLTGASVLDPGVATSYLVASLFAATLLPISFRVYRWGLKRAKREGTLGWY